MSLYESGESNGEVSIKSLFEDNPGESLASASAIGIESLAYLVCRGGWPRAVLKSDMETALDQALNYYESVVTTDISRSDGVKRNEQRTRALMRSYARNQGTQASIRALRADMEAHDSVSIDEDTVSSYINALKRILSSRIFLPGSPVSDRKPLYGPLIRGISQILPLRPRLWESFQKT